MSHEDEILIIEVRPLRRGHSRLLVVHRTPRVCVPWWRAVAAGLRLVLGLDA